jgi:hypothetical protein
MKIKISNGNCHFCGKPLGAVYIATGGKRFCPETDCLARCQDGETYQPSLHEQNKLSWKFQEQNTIPAWRLKYAPNPYD